MLGVQVEVERPVEDHGDQGVRQAEERQKDHGRRDGSIECRPETRVPTHPQAHCDGQHQELRCKLQKRVPRPPRDRRVQVQDSVQKSQGDQKPERPAERAAEAVGGVRCVH